MLVSTSEGFCLDGLLGAILFNPGLDMLFPTSLFESDLRSRDVQIGGNSRPCVCVSRWASVEIISRVKAKSVRI